MARDDLTGHLLKQRRKARAEQPVSDGRPRRAFDSFTWFVGTLLGAAVLSQFLLMLWFE